MTDHDDVLARMSRALGEQNSGESTTAAATRARILTTLGGSRAPSRRPWLAPVLLLVGVGSSAWASQNDAVRGWLAAVVPPSSERAGEPAVVSDETPDQRRQSRAREAARLQPGREAPAMQTANATADGTSSAAPPRAGSPAPSAPHAVAASASPSSSSAEAGARAEPPTAARFAQRDDGLGVYQSAHNAQFTARDCQAAVAGYRRYLTAFPGGAFEPEARYNSALCWIALGDIERARVALRPFAGGSYGNYRQNQARELLQALAPGSSGED